MSQELWEQVEKESIEEGILDKGGYMDIREEIKLDGIREGIERGRQEGKKEGRQEGRQECKKEIILNMLKNKIDISVISKVTGLSKEEIDKFKRIDS